MKPLVWVESRLSPDALARLEAVAEVIPSADLDDLPGADAAVISSGPAADGAFMDRAGWTMCNCS